MPRHMPRHASSARARYKNEQMIRQMAIATALLGFNDLGRSVTPSFLFRNRFYLQLSTHCPKMSKKSMWEVKKISRFLSPVKLWSLNANLFFEESHQLTKLRRLIGPFKPYWAVNTSLQSSNCNILGLAATVAFLDNETRFIQI